MGVSKEAKSDTDKGGGRRQARLTGFEVSVGSCRLHRRLLLVSMLRDTLQLLESLGFYM